ncbi:MAG: NUDIX hydrolase [Candidatus Saccharimonas sp.]
MLFRSHATFEISTKAVIYNETATKVLVMEYRGGKFYGLPGGHLDLGETPIQAMRRELVEELGVRDDFGLEPVDFFVHEGNIKRPRLILGYIGRIREDTPFVFDSHDYDERALWMNREQLVATEIADGYRTFISKHWPVS